MIAYRKVAAHRCTLGMMSLYSWQQSLLAEQHLAFRPSQGALSSAEASVPISHLVSLLAGSGSAHLIPYLLEVDQHLLIEHT